MTEKTALSGAILLENVTLSYARHPAVHHVSGTFAHGSLTAIAGPNGAGKSTLLKALAALKIPDTGHIHTEIPRSLTAYLPQASELQRDFPLNVQHLVSMGAWHRSGGFKTITSQLKADASRALNEVGLQGFEKRTLASLSAGQFQRALFARLIMQEAQLILLDEPFNAVDASTTAHLLQIVKQWHSEKRTVICVLHDFDYIRAHFPGCLLIARECIAWGNSIETLSPEHLAQAKACLEHYSAAPEGHGSCKALGSPAEICLKVS